MLIVRIFVLFAFSSWVLADKNVIDLNLHDRNFPAVQGKIHDVVKDDGGYYWLATSEGLKRYDGKEIQILFGEKQEALNNKLITTLKLQGRTLWVGSDTGLFSLDLKSFKLNSYPQFSANSSVSRAGFISNIDVDRLGRVWITSPKGVDLYIPDSDQFETFPIKMFDANKQDGYVVASAVDDEGGVWLATYSHGLQYLDTNIAEVVPAAKITKPTPDNAAHPLFSGRTNDVITSLNGGVLALAKGRIYSVGNSNKEIKALELGGAASVTGMVEDSLGVLWVVDKEFGLLKVAPNRSSFSYVVNETSNFKSQAMIQRAPGELIFVSESNSLEFLSQIERDISEIDFVSKDSISSSTLSGFTPKGSLSTKEGGTWLFSYAGRLIKFVDNAIVHDDSLELEIMDIASDERFLWLATGSGIYRYDPNDKSLKRITTAHSRQVKFSAESGIWVIGVNNVMNLRSGTVSTFSAGSDVSMWDRHLVIGPNNKIILVTSTYSYEFKPEIHKFTPFHQNNLDSKIYAATTVKNKLILLSRDIVIQELSERQGALKVIETNTIPYAIRGIFSLLLSGHDLWISGSSGKKITVLNLDNYQTKELNSQYGFPSNDGALLFKANSDTLTFLGSSRLVQLQNYWRYLLNYSGIVITKYEILSKSESPTSNYNLQSDITIEPDDYAIRFSFSDMKGHREDGRSIIEYRLLGQSNAWIQSSDNNAVFVGLMPGSYTFQVRNRYPPFHAETINITVVAALWQSDFAYASYALLVLLIIGIFVSLRRDKFVSELIADNQARIYAKGFENVTQGFCVMNSQGSIESTNLAFAKHFGEVGKVTNLQNLLLSQTDQDLFEEMYQHLSIGQDWRGLLYFKTLDDTVIPMECTAAEIAQNGDDDVYMLILSDVSERLDHQKHLENMARYDFLTGLPNRNYFTHYIVEKTTPTQGNNPSPFFVMFMDVDRFKNVNDSLSHEAGDQLLLSLSRILVTTIGDTGKVFRLGGDEFVVVCDRKPNLNPSATAGAIAKRLGRATEFGSNKLFVSLSIGISLFPQDGQTLSLLLSKADMAMYSAKNAGGNCFRFFTAKMEAQAAQSLRLESDIRRGISNKEFVVYYQAKVAMPTGSLVGYEALLRWQDPIEGLVSPIVFIDTAEKTGSIVQIGLFVLEIVCQQIQTWSKHHSTVVPVAINVSPQQLKQPSFYHDVVRILSDYDIPVELIEFEITEGVVMENMSICLGHLRRLKSRGHKIYIDDFGTGYSSLAYLQKLPIDVLKIDQSFVTNLYSDTDQQSIVKSIIDLALNLELDLVAEGVEDSETANYLMMLGCNVAQGYHYARPVPAHELPAVVENFATLAGPYNA